MTLLKIKPEKSPIPNGFWIRVFRLKPDQKPIKIPGCGSATSNHPAGRSIILLSLIFLNLINDFNSIYLSRV